MFHDPLFWYGVILGPAVWAGLTGGIAVTAMAVAFVFYVVRWMWRALRAAEHDDLAFTMEVSWDQCGGLLLRLDGADVVRLSVDTTKQLASTAAPVTALATALAEPAGLDDEEFQELCERIEGLMPSLPRLLMDHAPAPKK